MRAGRDPDLDTLVDQASPLVAASRGVIIVAKSCLPAATTSAHLSHVKALGMTSGFSG